MEAPAVASKVDSVTVFRQGALVTRLAVLGPATARPGLVRLSGLPLALDDGSLRVRLDAAGGGPSPLAAASTRVVLEVPEADEALLPPDDEALKEARREEAHLATRLDGVAWVRGRVEAASVPRRPSTKRGQAPQPPPWEARETFVAFQSGELERLDAEVEALRISLRQARRRREELEERDRQASSARKAREHELRKAALVELAGQAAEGPVALAVEYLVPGARWAPSYAFDVENGARGRLALRAMVCQRSGEDWRGARLLLTTADAQSWVELPELPSLRIGRVQPRPARRGFRPAPEGAEALYADFDQASAPKAAKVVAKSPPPLPAPPPPAMPQQPPRKELTKAGLLEEDGRLGLGDDAEDTPVSSADYADQVFALGSRASALEAAALLPDEAPTAGGFGGAPGSFPETMAAPQAKSRGLLSGLVGARAPVPRRSPAPAAGAPVAAAAAQPLGRAAPPEPPPALGGTRPDDRMLAFGRLRMPSPEEPGRGALVLASEQTLYLELLVEQRVEVAFDVQRLLAAAVSAASAVSALPPPRGHRFPVGTRFAHAYAARAAVDVPSDGRFHSIPLLAEEGPLELRHVTVPRESQDVFRRVEWRSPLAAPLLEGPVDVSVDGRYLLTSRLGEVPGRGLLRLGLGVEPAIKVSRNTRYDEETKGLMGGSLALKHGIEVDLQSHLDGPALVEVRERVPVTREEEGEITVEVTRAEPAWEPFEQDEEPLRGGHAWRVRLEPRGKAHLEASYVVRIASKHQLVGGNRREG